MNTDVRQIVLDSNNAAQTDNRLTNFVCDCRDVTGFISPYYDYEIGLKSIQYSGHLSTFLPDRVTNRSRGFIKLGFFSPKLVEVGGGHATTFSSILPTYYLPYRDFKTLGELTDQIKEAIRVSLVGVVDNPSTMADYIIASSFEFGLDENTFYFETRSSASQASAFQKFWDEHRTTQLTAPFAMRVMMSTDLLQMFGQFSPPTFSAKDLDAVNMRRLPTTYAMSSLNDDDFMSDVEYDNATTVAIVPLLLGIVDEQVELDSTQKSTTTKKFVYDGKGTLSPKVFTSDDARRDGMVGRLGNVFYVRPPRSFPSYMFVTLSESEMIPPTSMSDNSTSTVLASFPLRGKTDGDVVHHEVKNINYMDLARTNYSIGRFRIVLHDETRTREVPILSGASTVVVLNVRQKKKKSIKTIERYNDVVR